MLKWIDLPPIWLLLALVIVWRVPDLPMFGGQRLIGTALVGLGVGMMALAVWEMRKKRTTVIPHLTASTLVTSGIFSRTRNPIYLGDVLVLVGLILRWQAHPVSLVLVPLFIWIITVRFIHPEESRLKKAFGPAFDAYCAATRRWA